VLGLGFVSSYSQLGLGSKNRIHVSLGSDVVYQLVMCSAYPSIEFFSVRVRF
jgi:hypothetical protein